MNYSPFSSISADSDYETDFYNSDDETIEPTKKATDNTEIKSKYKLEFSEDLDADVLKLAMEYSDVFNEFVDSTRTMDTETMKIELRDDRTVIPIYVANPRQIPLHWRSEARCLLTTMVDAGILRPVTSPRSWCSPVCFVRKGTEEPLKLLLDERLPCLELVHFAHAPPLSERQRDQTEHQRQHNLPHSLLTSSADITRSSWMRNPDI